MLFLAPSLLCLASLLSRKLRSSAEYAAKTFIGFQDAKVVHRLPSGEVEENKGHDDLLIRPALYFHVKMGGDALPQIEDGSEVRGRREGLQARSCRLLSSLFRTCRANALCHNSCTSLVIDLVSRPYSIIPVHQGQRGFLLYLVVDYGAGRVKPQSSS